jgi:hypothetical protein
VFQQKLNVHLKVLNEYLRNYFQDLLMIQPLIYLEY